MNPWRSVVGHRPIVTRLVVAVATTMAIVLVAAGAFVFWRVHFALNRQVDQDLKAYQEIVERAVKSGVAPPANTPGESYQIYDLRGRVIGGNAVRPLADRHDIAEATAGSHRKDVGRLIPPADHPYRVVMSRVETGRGDVVVVSAISRNKRDEALRELLLQLAIADLATLFAASVVGYRAARAALNPVERFRVAAASSDGSSLLPVATGRDDEIARLGHTFNDLLERINRASSRERQFLADASHELRSPLALMRTELEMALRRPRSEKETHDAFESLRVQVERLIVLSNALLDLEELRASGPPAREPIDLEQLADHLGSRIAAQPGAANRPFHADIPQGATVDGNSHWLELALNNLVSNALIHGDGAITVVVTQQAGRTQITINDEGEGIPTEFRDRAFDRFTRAETSRTSPGSGLGLALVQAVAEAHGGTATVHGSAATIDLPT
jgi:signal transduction histidine kinase